MRKVIKHGKHYNKEQMINYTTYVNCPECNLKVYCDLRFPKLLICKCGCEFEFENEDVKHEIST